MRNMELSKNIIEVLEGKDWNIYDITKQDGKYYVEIENYSSEDSSNPNINRCQFIAVPGTLAYMEKPVVIAESVLGIEGCFMELLGFINPCVQKTYYEDGFNEWLLVNFNFEITYKDGLVFMLERSRKLC